MTRLCVADTCRPVRGRHLPDCQHQDEGLYVCPGCLPKLAEVGLEVCGGCEDRVRRGLRELPALWVDLLTPTRPGSRLAVPSGEEYPAAIMGDPGYLMRDAIRNMLLTWAKILMEERHVTCPPDTIRGMAHLIAVQAGWLLGSVHADQLVHDVVWVHDTARRTAHPGRPDGVRVECPACGQRVKLDLASEVTRCVCGEWGTVEWWREQLAPDSDGLKTAPELISWLLMHHRMAVEEATIRQWATREWARGESPSWAEPDTDELESPPSPPGMWRSCRLSDHRVAFEPGPVVEVARRLTGQRRRGRMSA